MTPKAQPSAFILGGNANTLAFTSSFKGENEALTTWLVPLAWTPIGVAFGETWQRVSVALDAVGSWVDQTFPPEDERSFVGSVRDIEMLIRLGWHAEAPTVLHEDAIVNLEDLPPELAEGLSESPAELTQCAMCRRLCVRDHFVWNERRLCAWDFHSLVFGRRGPWRNEPYEERHFATLPRPRYVAPQLLDEANVDIVAAFHHLPEPLLHELVQAILGQSTGAAHLAARTQGGIVVLRERTEETMHFPERGHSG